MSASPGVRVIEQPTAKVRVPRSADRDGARRRRQGQPPPDRRADRAAADRRRAPNRSATPRVVDIGGARLAITADSFVVTPLRFPGGSIGELAVNGTVNDLAVSGARPVGLLVTFVLEAGLPSDVLEAEVRAMGGGRAARRRARSSAATPRSSSTARPTGMYITTTGIGELLPGVSLAPRQRAARRSRAGVGPDRRSRHHDPAGARRPRPRGRPRVRHALGAAAGRRAGRRGGARRALDARPDPRRRGHRAQRAGARCGLGVALVEERMPVRDGVRGACELLGLDPLHIANEGQFLAVVAPELARRGAGGARRRRRAASAPSISARSAISRPARCSSKPATAAAGSSTCWSAIRCRGSADGRACHDRRPVDLDRHASQQRLLRRATPLSRAFFAREAPRLARRAGRWPSASCAAAGCWRSARARYATDAQHVSVEFVHPVIVGKRALPAHGSVAALRPWLDAICRPDDMVMGFGPPGGDPGVHVALEKARRRGAMTFALPGQRRRLRRASSTRPRLRAPGADRDPVPHALGDRARLLRAPRAGPRRRAGRLSLSVPRHATASTRDGRSWPMSRDRSS